MALLKRPVLVAVQTYFMIFLQLLRTTESTMISFFISELLDAVDVAPRSITMPDYDKISRSFVRCF